jgi:hypothetical protein
MAAFNKFNCFVEDLAEKQHNLGADALKVQLTDTTPAATDTAFDTTQYPDPAVASGYTSGGAAVTVTASAQTGGTYALAGNDVVFAAAGGQIGPFRYAVLGNATAGKPIGWWDYGSSITLNDAETFTVDFGAAILTLA